MWSVPLILGSIALVGSFAGGAFLGVGKVERLLTRGAVVVGSLALSLISMAG